MSMIVKEIKVSPLMPIRVKGLIEKMEEISCYTPKIFHFLNKLVDFAVSLYFQLDISLYLLLFATCKKLKNLVHTYWSENTFANSYLSSLAFSGHFNILF